jgi:hypothetical protein
MTWVLKTPGPTLPKLAIIVNPDPPSGEDTSTHSSVPCGTSRSWPGFPYTLGFVLHLTWPSLPWVPELWSPNTASCLWSHPVSLVCISFQMVPLPLWKPGCPRQCCFLQCLQELVAATLTHLTSTMGCSAPLTAQT